MDLKGRVVLIALAFVGFLLWTSWRAGYESAIEDVRYGNVKVVCEVCLKDY